MLANWPRPHCQTPELRLILNKFCENKFVMLISCVCATGCMRKSKELVLSFPHVDSRIRLEQPEVGWLFDVYVHGHLTCMYVCALSATDAFRSRKKSLDPPYGCWNPNPCPLEEQLILIHVPFPGLLKLGFILCHLCGCVTSSLDLSTNQRLL